MTIWVNSPVRIDSRSVHCARSRIDRGRLNSMPIIRPRPRTSCTSSCRFATPSRPEISAAPIVDARSTIDSASMVCSVASPAVIASTFWPNVELCTTARSILSKTRSTTSLFAITAPTGT